MKVHYSSVLEFWFSELGSEDWFEENPDTDVEITKRFGVLHEQVAANELEVWRNEPLGALAEVLILDQFSRNMFRGDARSYAYDGHALALAQVALERGFDHDVDELKRPFFYLPFMHSESRVIHERAVSLFEKLGSVEHLKFEHMHKDIIDRFGRYPHRNKVLGRSTTEAEARFLAENDLPFG